MGEQLEKHRSAMEQLRDLEKCFDRIEEGDEIRRVLVVLYLKLALRIAEETMSAQDTPLRHAERVVKANHRMLAKMEVLSEKLDELEFGCDTFQTIGNA